VSEHRRFQYDVDELEMRADAPAEPHPSHRPSTLGALIVLAILIAGVGWWFYRRPAPVTQPQPDQPQLAAPSSVPAEFGPVPPLDQSDAFLRALVRQLSSRPELLAWLATDNLARQFTVVVDKIAIGTSPAKEMKAAAPSGSFATLGAGTALRIDPKSYERYNTFAQVVDSIDTEGAARAYRRVRPLLQEAFAELGYTDITFDERFALALGRLVDTPVPDGPVYLRPTSVTYQFADPDLEALSSAQKHLLRMGPQNMRLVQNKIRQFARAAGLTKTS
jgi:Protein of unknown function (DUF3014)